MVDHHLGYNTKLNPPNKKLTFPFPTPFLGLKDHSTSMTQFSNQFGNEMVVKDSQKQFKIANKFILFYLNNIIDKLFS
jgi:hypothetical protein